jgi:hypothetical protein
MSNKLFFVDSILHLTDNDDVHVSLFETEPDSETGFITVSVNRDQLGMRNHKGTIKEGWYVYYNSEDSQIPFAYGNLAPFARRQFNEFKTIQSQLIEKIVSVEESDSSLYFNIEKSHTNNVVSYHVNVGHGNCSLILIQDKDAYEIWMVDCSLRDKTNWHNPCIINNLDDCFLTIKQQLDIRDSEHLHISRFFLTHPHYDHYNGITYLIDNEYIDSETLFYVNLFYHVASPAYLKVLNELNAMNVRFIEPVSHNSTNAIKFLYPDCRTYRSDHTAINKPANYQIVKSPLNNSSSVIMFNIAHRTMVFPGDLEQDGFVIMPNKKTCNPFLCNVDYYIISHHGSLNGHPFNDYKCPKQSYFLPSCNIRKLCKAILMGRDKAYSGIYNQTVENFWSNCPCELVYTEHDPSGNKVKFVELDWSNGTVKYY